MDITKEQWLQWKSDPSTKWFLNKIKENLENLKNDIIEDRFSDQHIHKSIGIGMGLKVVLEISPDFSEENQNES